MDQQQQHRAVRALEVARRCVAERFAGASCAFASGSILRGEGNALSDIDLVIVFPTLPRAWRESFDHGGFPIEAFVQDPQTLRYFMAKDMEMGAPIMVNMVATGVILGDDVVARAIQGEAREALARGPEPLAGPRYDTLRYMISDIADDLRAERPVAEMAGLAAMLYPQLIDLMLLGRGEWSGKGKWAPRLLARCDQELADALTAALAKAAGGDPRDLVAITDSELARHGGRFFAGHRQEAPLEARREEPLG